MDILQFKKANCKNCFKCLRECPVKSISYKQGQAEIIAEDCLLCGHCLTVCPQNAKEARNDTDIVKAAIASGRRVVATVAPSFAAAFGPGGISAFASALKKLGFFDVRETAVGAKAVAEEYGRLLAGGRFESMVSTCCPTVIRLAERYCPQSLKYLAPVTSPMTAHARMLRKEFGDDIFVVFIGPCLCKKDEAGWDENAVDCALTFEELKEWLDQALPEAAAASAQTPGPAENGAALRARIFPVRGGVIATIPDKPAEYAYVSADGIQKCRETLEALARGELKGFFIEMNACEGGCINGPCMISPSGGLLAAERSVSDNAQAPIGAKAAEVIPVELGRRFEPKPRQIEMPGENDLREILARTGKTLPEHELNCGACGYPTCRDKAVAVYQGRAEVDMCMPYMRERAEFISDKVISFSPNAVVALDSRLNIQAMNGAAQKMFGVSDTRLFSGRYIGELTDPGVFEEAAVRKENVLDRRVYLYHYGIWVEESVVYVKEHDFVFGIFKDMTDVEREKEKLKKVKLDTVETADQVIEKQMRVVQEIAMLLGETTAQTKIALTKLKDTMMSEDEASRQ